MLKLLKGLFIVGLIIIVGKKLISILTPEKKDDSQDSYAPYKAESIRCETQYDQEEVECDCEVAAPAVQSTSSYMYVPSDDAKEACCGSDY